VGFEHALAVLLHTGSTLHLHAALPGEPVQVCREPHTTGGPYAQQPLLPSVHVATPFDTHVV